MSRRSIPPILEELREQLLIGFGRIAGRAVAAAGKSVAKDVEHMGKVVQRRASKARETLDKLVEAEDDGDKE